MQDIISVLGIIAGGIMSLEVILGTFVAVSKWGRKRFSNWFSKIIKDSLNESLEPIKKVSRRTLRIDIENMCEKYRNRGSITIDEHRELTEAKEEYVAVNGNGSTVCIVNGTLSLPVKG